MWAVQTGLFRCGNTGDMIDGTTTQEMTGERGQASP